MGVSANEVKIVVAVEDKGTSEVLHRMSMDLTQLGEAGEKGGRRFKSGVEEANKGVTNSLDNVRLFSQELGLRMPRAMEHAMARSQMLASAVNSLGGAFLALGTIEIGAHLVQGLYGVYEKYLDVNAAQREYSKELMKSRTEDFGNTRSIEDTRARIQSATEDIQAMDRAMQAIQGRHWSWLTTPFEELFDRKKFSELMVERQKALVQLKSAGGEQQHDLTLQAISRDHSSAGLTGAAARQAELQRKLAENKENQAYRREQDKLQHNLTSSNAGDAERKMQDQLARQEAAGEAAKDARAQEQETRKMEADAREAGLRGEAVYMAQRDQMLDELREKMRLTELSPIMYARQVAAVNERYDNERMKRLEEQRRETEMMQVEAALAGFRGMGKIQAQGDIDIGRIRSDSGLDDATKDERVAAIKMRVNQELLEAERQYAEEANALADETADHQISAIGRIRSEAQRTIDEKRRAYEEQTKDINRSTPEGEQAYQSATASFRKETSAVTSSADRDVMDQRRQMEQETEQAEAEARSRELAAHKQQTSAIEEQYEERFRKIEEWKQRELASDKLTIAEREDIENQAGRRELAAFQDRNAEMLEAARSAREKMSGEFTSLFRSFSEHPTEGIKDLGAKISGEIAAAGMQRVQNHFGGAISKVTGAQPGESPWQHVLDRLAGTPAGSASTQSSTAANPPHAPLGVGRGRASSVGSSAISLASAEINVGTANIAFQGFGGSSSGAPGASGPSGSFHGFTPAFAPQQSTVNAGGWPSAGADDSSSSGGGYTSARGGASFAVDGQSAGTVSEIYANSAAGGSAPSWTGVGASGSAGSTAASVSSYGRTYGSGAGPGAAMGASASTLAPGGGASGGGFYGTGSPGSTHSAVASGVGYARQGVALYKQANSIFGAHGSDSQSLNPDHDSSVDNIRFDKDGNQVQDSSSNGGMLNGGGFANNAMGAASGAIGLYSAFEAGGGIGGAASGAMSGMELGASLAGPMGAAVGAAAGAIIGAIGFGGREKARVWWLKNGRNRMQNDTDSFQQGGMDYLSAMADIEQLKADANHTTNAMGKSAEGYYQDTIKPEIAKAEANLTREQKAGRSQFAASTASYAVGSDYIPATGLNLNHEGERIIPSDQNKRITRALEAGADAKMPAMSGFGGDVHLHVHAMDTKSVKQFLFDNKHGIRSALNASYAENSGGADA